MFGHPRGLAVLFLTEMWEKFSYYGMRALLVYYMTKELLITQQDASLIYGAYIASAYFTPIVGGIVIDRWLEPRRAVLLGGTIMAAGHFMMAFHGLFYPALATIALGNGLYLPALPSQIAGLYTHEDPKRVAAYNIYYAGINLGGFLAPLICGALGELYGWHWGFGAAGIGMLCGLVVYAYGSRWLPANLARASGGAVAVTPPAAPSSPPRTYLMLGLVLAAVVVFRGAYEQLGNTVALWADNGVDRSIGPHRIPMTWFQSLNSLLVFVLTPLFVAHWASRARRGLDSSPTVKMAQGAAIVASSYLLLGLVAAWSAAHGAAASWVWLVAFFVILTAGELYILPVGLALFGRIAPARVAATVIAVWFSAICLGNLLAGALGTLWSHLSARAFFVLMAGVAGIAALALWSLDGPMRRLEGNATVSGERIQEVDERPRGIAHAE